MLLCKLLWFVAVSGVSVRALKLTAAEDKVSVNVRQNASLHWTFQINKGETYRILWATSTVDAAGIAGHTTLYNKKPGISAKKQQISRVGKENHG